jgi:hypothetical protein
MLWRSLLPLVGLLSASLAQAQPPPGAAAAVEAPPAAPQPAAIPPGRRALAVGAALLPGALVHGSGHFVAGETETAAKLLALEGLGLGALAGGIVGLAATGASRRLVAPLILTSTAGAGLFAISWLADVYGVAVPAAGRGEGARIAPTFETRFGTRYVYDPTLLARVFIGPSVDARLGGFRLGAAAWVAVDESNVRAEALGAYRLYGPRPWGGGSARDGSFLEVGLGLVHHRYGAEQFDMTTVDGRVEGRADLVRLAAPLAGIFAEGQAGVGLGAYHYTTGARATEANSLLLARFAFGVYLGRRSDRRGEVRLYYDNRHDDFAGGLKARGLGSGAPGHFGVDAVAYFSRAWGVRAEAEAGSAYVLGLSVVHRSGRLDP